MPFETDAVHGEPSGDPAVVDPLAVDWMFGQWHPSRETGFLETFLVIAFAAISMLLLWTGNVVIPKLLWDSNLRDSDTALWFCAGILLTEVTLFGWVIAWQIGRLQRRILAGAFLTISFAIAGFAATIWIGPMSRADATGYLLLVLGAMFFFGACDCLLLRLTRLGIVASQQSKERPARSRVQFNTLFLLGLAAWMACVMGLISYALRCDQIAYRPYREYADSGVVFLSLLVFFFWILHWSLLWSTLRRSNGWGILSTIAIVVLGTEAIRRFHPIHLQTPTSYIEWEFPLIVLGFVTAHIVLGCVIRWRGWELKVC